MIDEKEIINNIKRVSKNVVLKDVLMEFEELLENSGLYAYANWFDGEIVDGPNVSTHWVDITLMYPYENMPDPRGGMRLSKYNTKVTYQKGVHKYPTEIVDENDVQDQITKKAVMNKDKIWLISIKMPAKYIESGIDDYINADIKDIDVSNQSNIDIKDDI